MTLRLLVLLTVISFTDSVRGDVKLPPIFGDHMVVQRDAKIPIWGTADAGESVEVKVAGQTQSATTDAAGKWRVVLDPIKSDGPVEISINGKNAVTLQDVLVGEVWLCSGQSNMGMVLSRVAGGADAVKAADRQTVRLFTVSRSGVGGAEDPDPAGKWLVCSPETSPQFSAVAYLFGIELQKKLNTPMGLIDSSWGGTRAEAWIPKPTFDALKLPYEPEWTEEWLDPKVNPKAKTPARKRPEQGPAALYDTMIAPLAGYAIRGAVWYQGETNTAYANEYGDVLAGLVTSWRQAWGQGDFPFLVVQLPNFLGKGRDWPALRAGQARVARDLPNVGLAVTIDVGETKDIHPKDKITVGKRLAAAAEKIAYGHDVPYAGPTFKSVKVEGGTAILQFDHVDGGLLAKGGTLKGFAVAGNDGKFVPAKATIDGTSVRVSAEGVAVPTSVQYAWENDPACTLYNAAGFPAVPFTTAGK